jgi:phosphoglycerol transferase MdoB-like AlkP superfamily enzyme
MGLRKQTGLTEQEQKRKRLIVHNTFAVIFLACVFIFRAVDNGSLIQLLLVVAGYTYGPLLALFAFGIFTKLHVRNELVPIVCIAAPSACYILKQNDKAWLGGYSIGTELLIINAAITFILLLFISRKGGALNTVK